MPARASLDRGVGPAAFNTNHPGREFIIRAALEAADESGRPQISRAPKIEAARRGAILADGISQHSAADMAAQIDASPVIDRRRQGRIVGAGRNGNVGRMSGHGREREAAQHQSPNRARQG